MRLFVTKVIAGDGAAMPSERCDAGGASTAERQAAMIVDRRVAFGSLMSVQRGIGFVKTSTGNRWLLLVLLVGLGGSNPADLLAQQTEEPPPNAQQGVEAIEKAIERSKSPAEKTKVAEHLIRGRFVAPPGSTFPSGWGGLVARSQSSSLSSTIQIDADGRFEKTVRGPATFFVFPRLEGFAQKSYGPFELGDGPVDLGDLRLDVGFTGRLVIQNERGEPVGGVKIESFHRSQLIGGRKMRYGSSPEVGSASDEAGVIQLTHVTQEPVEISLIAPGYEQERREVTFAKEATIDWRLTAAAPVSGQLVDSAGKGIAGVELWLAKRDGPNSQLADPRNMFLLQLAGGTRSQEPMAVSDADGRFQVDSLRKDTQYWLMALHPNHRPHVLAPVTAGASLEPITLGKPLVVKGRIKGDLSRLVQRSGKPYFSYRNVLTFDSTNYDAGFGVTVDPDGTFRLTQLLAGEVQLFPGNQKVTVTLSESIDDLVIDLDKPVARPNENDRPIRVVLNPTAGQPIRGEVQLSWRLATKPAVGPQSKYESFPAGKTIDWRAPAGAEVAFQGSKLVGSIVAYTRMGTVSEGEGVQEFSIDIDPAGLASGQVVEADGRPLTGYRIDVDRGAQHVHAFQVHGLRVRHPEGRFAAGPLPLGSEHRYQAFVQADDSWRVAVSAPFLVTRDQPVFEQTIKMPPTVYLVGRVLNTYGEPVSAAPLSMMMRTMRSSRSVGSQQATDGEGRFRIPISSELAEVSFQFSILPSQGTAGRTFEFRGNEFTEDRDFGDIRLQPSATIRGFVLDEAGKPRSNVTISLKPYDNEIADYQGDRQDRSDANGAFEITGVERVPQLIYLYGKQLVDATAPFRIEQDGAANQRWIIEPTESEIDVTLIVK